MNYVNLLLSMRTPTDIAGKNKRKMKATKEDETSGKKGQIRSKDDKDFLIK